MRGKQDFSTFSRICTSRFGIENDGCISNLVQAKEHPLPRPAKNYTFSEDEKMLQDPLILSLCINNLENQLKCKEGEYQDSITNLKQKIWQKQIQGKTLNEELKQLRQEMSIMKSQMAQLTEKVLWQMDSPYQLHEPRRKLRKNKSSQFIGFKGQNRSKSKKQYRF